MNGKAVLVFILIESELAGEISSSLSILRSDEWVLFYPIAKKTFQFSAANHIHVELNGEIYISTQISLFFQNCILETRFSLFSGRKLSLTGAGGYLGPISETQ